MSTLQSVNARTGETHGQPLATSTPEQIDAARALDAQGASGDERYIFPLYFPNEDRNTFTTPKH